jgi:hypothetical protein
MVHLRTKILISWKNHLKLITKTSCGHHAIYYEQNVDNNDWIQILNYIKKKTINFLNKKQNENIELHELGKFPK